MSAERLDHMADVPCTTPTFVVAAVLFNLLFVYSIFLFFRHRAWFFAVFSVALGLEAGGFIALSCLSTRLTDHTAYLISFSTLTLAPSFLILAILAAFARLMNNVEHAEQHSEPKTVILSRGWVVAIFMLAEVLAVLHFVLGIADLSALHASMPIMSKDEAFARLVFQAEAVSHFNTGYIIQLVCLALFILIGYLSMSVEHITIDSEWGRRPLGHPIGHGLQF